jgi:hypothetical protein
MPLVEPIVKRIKNCKGPLLSLSNSGLFDSDIAELCPLIERNPNIFKLDLEDNNISDESAKVLATLSRVKSLNLVKNDITNQGVITIIANTNINELNLSTNRGITDEAEKCLTESKHLIFLQLNRTCISDKLIEKIQQQIEKNKKEYNEKEKQQNSYTEKCSLHTSKKTITTHNLFKNNDPISNGSQNGAAHYLKPESKA